MMDLNSYLESLLEQCGGLGRFQWIVMFAVVFGELGPTWSMLMMAFAGYIPTWRCEYSVPYNSYDTSDNTTNYMTNVSTSVCIPPKETNISKCGGIDFDQDKRTVVNEWSLICDKDWVSSTITTVQMGGFLVSGLTAGQLSDSVGRKPSFFLSLLLLTVFNIIAAFSVSWQMFIVLRFFIGYACGCFYVIYIGYIMEFTPTRYRALVKMIPAWSVSAAVFGGVSMWLHDWSKLHIANAIVTAPFLLFWWFFPESFSWLAANRKVDEATLVVTKIAKTNGKPVPDLSQLKWIIEQELESADSKEHYSVKDIFSHGYLIKITLLLGFAWLSCAYSYYAISFGVQSLSGSLYLNMFLLSLVEIPALIIDYFLVNHLGRRPTAILFLLIASIGGLVVAVLQVSDSIPNKDKLINGFALTAKLGVAAGWAAVGTLSAEIYPTVVRNIGYGFVNSVARIGSMVSPQIVFLNTKVPGIMYFLCGGMMLLTAIAMFFLSETKGRALENTIISKSEEKDSICKKEKERNEEVIGVEYNKTGSINISYIKD